MKSRGIYSPYFTKKGKLIMKFVGTKREKELILKALGYKELEGVEWDIQPEPLLPCPFCGGEAELTEEPFWLVKCTNCGCGTDAKLSEFDAIDAWQARSGYNKTQRIKPIKIITTSKHDTTTYQCLNCGTQFIDENLHFCSNCGQALDWDDEE